jgi:hypothetical protein
MEHNYKSTPTKGGNKVITLDQLKNKSKKTGLTLYQQEKDYLLKLFLYNYYKKFEDAVFKGGTCIKYLYGLNRFSEDLDFNIKIKPEKFKKQVRETLKQIEITGIKTYLLKEEIFQDAYTTEIGFHGPLYKGTEQTRNKIRLDAGKRIGTVEEPAWKIIPSEYPETKENFLVKTMDEEEMLVEKIISLIERNKGRDLYDTWFMLEKGVKVNRKLFQKKYNSKNINLKNIPTEKEYIRDMEILTNRVIPYKQITKKIRESITKINR